MTRVARIGVVYYSATGNVHRLAHALAGGAGGEGAEVRLRHVEELASELVISQNQYWGRHRSEVEDEPVASLEDLEWADGVAFGTPTRGRSRRSLPSATVSTTGACSSSRSATRRARCSTPEATRTAPPTRAGRGSRVPMRERSRSPATRASVSPAMPRSSPPPARRTPSAPSGRS